jgi:hypothetical protein
LQLSTDDVSRVWQIRDFLGLQIPLLPLLAFSGSIPLFYDTLGRPIPLIFVQPPKTSYVAVAAWSACWRQSHQPRRDKRCLHELNRTDSKLLSRSTLTTQSADPASAAR